MPSPWWPRWENNYGRCKVPGGHLGHEAFLSHKTRIDTAGGVQRCFEDLASAISAELIKTRAGRPGAGVGSACFIGTKCLPGGDKFKPLLIQALQEAKLVVVVITKELLDELEELREPQSQSLGDPTPGGQATAEEKEAMGWRVESWVLWEIWEAQQPGRPGGPACFLPVIVPPEDVRNQPAFRSMLERLSSNRRLTRMCKIEDSRLEMRVAEMLKPLNMMQAMTLDPWLKNEDGMTNIAKTAAELLDDHAPLHQDVVLQKVFALGYRKFESDYGGGPATQAPIIRWIGSATLVGWNDYDGPEAAQMALLTCTHVLQSVPANLLFRRDSKDAHRFNLVVGLLYDSGSGGTPLLQPLFEVAEVVAVPSRWAFGADLALLHVNIGKAGEKILNALLNFKYQFHLKHLEQSAELQIIGANARLRLGEYRESPPGGSQRRPDVGLINMKHSGPLLSGDCGGAVFIDTAEQDIALVGLVDSEACGCRHNPGYDTALEGGLRQAQFIQLCATGAGADGRSSAAAFFIARFVNRPCGGLPDAGRLVKQLRGRKVKIERPKVKEVLSSADSGTSKAHGLLDVVKAVKPRVGAVQVDLKIKEAEFDKFGLRALTMLIARISVGGDHAPLQKLPRVQLLSMTFGSVRLWLQLPGEEHLRWLCQEVSSN